MLSIGLRVCWDVEAKKKTERNNAGKLEPGYSAQLDAAASNRHEQEKSIRPTRLLSKGHPPWEGVERIKAKKKVAEEESELEWQFVVFFVRSAASDLEITFILSPIIPSMFIIPDPSLFFTVIQSFHSYCPFQVSNDTKKKRKAGKNGPRKNIWTKPKLSFTCGRSNLCFSQQPQIHTIMFIFIP